MTTLATLARRAHERYASQPAILSGSSWLTFADLGAAARRTANRLLTAGLRPGDRVVTALDNGPEVLIVEHALFLSGLVRVAVSSRLHGQEIVTIAADCGAAAVVCEPVHAELLAGHRSTLPRLRTLVAANDDGAGAASDSTLADLVAPGAPETAPDVPAPTEDDVAALMYTSGTTGRPKGAIVTHAGWLAMLRAFWAELPPSGPGDIVLHVAPMSHFGGSAGSAYTFRGAAVVPVRRFDPPRVLDLMAEHQVSVLPLVPTMLKELTAAAEDRATAGRPFRPTWLRAVPYGGSAISAQALVRAREVFGDVLYQCYGLSEALAPLTVLSAAEHRPGPSATVPARLSSAGRPVAEIELQVVDVGDVPVPVGTSGEVRVRGAAVMPGYWDRPEETNEVLSADGWFRTGDLGRLDDAGYLYLVDRRREVIVSGGFNVYPSEVERAIAELDAVQEVVVVGVPHERWGEAVAAVVVTRPGFTLSCEDVVTACRERLASYKKPLYVEFATELPVSGNGKLRRREIREKYWTDRARLVGE